MTANDRTSHLPDVAAPTASDNLFNRVVSILEKTRANVVRAVNSNMVVAYWLIGREIVTELQGGDERAEYGRQVIENLSRQLAERYGKGFSAPNLWKFRQFYQVYSSREPAILSPAGRELEISPQSIASDSKEILSPRGIEYMEYLPSEEELAIELERERKLIEEHLSNAREE